MYYDYLIVLFIYGYVVLTDELAVYRGLNVDLSKRLSEISKFNVRTIYSIGNVGPRGKLLVRIDKSRKNKPLLVPNCIHSDQSSLFLIKAKAPRSSVNNDQYLSNLLAGFKYQYTEIHMYILVSTNNLTAFMSEIFMQNFPRDVFDLNKYGRIVLSRISGSPSIENKYFGRRGFNELYALKHIAMLDADFVVEFRSDIGQSCNDYNDSKVFFVTKKKCISSSSVTEKYSVSLSK